MDAIESLDVRSDTPYHLGSMNNGPFDGGPGLSLRTGRQKRVCRALAARFAIVALVTSTAGCGRDCGCCSGEKTYETLDGPVKVELVRSVHTPSSHMITFPKTQFALRVHTSPPFDHAVPCSKVQMAEDDTGKLVAFRCEGDAPWHVLRLRSGDRRLLDCSAPVGVKDVPDFASLPPLAASVDRILGCASTQAVPGYTPEVAWGELVRSIGEDAGRQPALDLVKKLATRPPADSNASGGIDPWLSALEALPAEDRKTAFVPACAALGDAHASPLAYVRGARLCDLEGSGLASEAIARFRAGLADTGPEGRANQLRDPSPHVAWAAVIALRNDPTTAGTVACEALGRMRVTSLSHGTLALAAIGVSRTRCDAVRSLPDHPPCGKDFDCQGALCGQPFFEAPIRAWVDQATADVAAGSARPQIVSGHQRTGVLMAALYAQGDLPEEIVIRNARRRYTFESSSAPSCDDTLPFGAPCRCAGFDPGIFCFTPAASKETTSNTCRFKVDDARRLFVDVRHVCAQRGEGCGANRQPCCAGLTCSEGESKSLLCMP